MSFLSGMDIAASGLTAQRTRMDVISENIANMDTTRTADGGPYTRKFVAMEERDNNFSSVLRESAGDQATGELAATNARHIPTGENAASAGSKSGVQGGVRISEIGEDTQSTYGLEYDPTNPDANADGYVTKPNVDLTQEMVDMMEAYRSYEANVTAFNAYKDMAVKTFEMGV